MKKFYSLLAASAVIFAASATETQALRGEVQIPVGRQKVMNGMFAESASQYKLPAKSRQVKGMRKADGVQSIEGDWYFVLVDQYFGDESTFDGAQVLYTATVDGTIVTFEPNDSNYLPMIAEYDEEEGTFTFSREYVGQAEGYFCYQEPFIYNYDTQDLDFQDIEGELCVSQDVIVFNDYPGIAWAAYSDQAGTASKGFINLLDLRVAYPPMEGEWKELGNATFIDGWLLTGFGEDQFTNKYEVPLEQNADNENLYRLVNPYKAGPLAQMNQSRSNGYIVFDVSDPDHVVFLLYGAGFASSELEISQFYAYNTLGFFCLINPAYYPEELVDYFGNEFPYTTFKEGVVNLNGVSKENKAPDARVGFSFEPTYGMYWAIDNKGTPANMTAQIVFPGADGVGSVAVDDSNAAVEYFNLQGVRISNPEPGQIVIKRQGNNVTKSIAK